ncbi:hypothetical protein BDFG_01779 [Blastomyces dermatitidis ATCC 26199]|nr:hypothetical protein BDFG_01779 [Blastomyces dermatitidis ATCC 26199]
MGWDGIVPLAGNNTRNAAIVRWMRRVRSVRTVPGLSQGLIDCGSNLGQQPINQHLSATTTTVTTTTTTVTITNHRHWQSSRAWSRRAWMQPLKVSANQRRRGPAHPSSPYAYCILVRPSGLR